MQNSGMYHNCSSPCELSIRNLNVIARLNPNSSPREAYYLGDVVLPAFKSHTSIAAMIYLVFKVLNIAPYIYINSPPASQFRQDTGQLQGKLKPFSVLVFLPLSLSLWPIHPLTDATASFLKRKTACRTSLNG